MPSASAPKKTPDCKIRYLFSGEVKEQQHD